jgi:hypothetical protein
VITAEPTDNPETNPVFETVATAVLFEAQLSAVPVPES